MAGTEGGVSLDITPNARDFWRQLDAQLKPGSKAAGDSIGRSLSKAIGSSGTPAAREFARRFKTTLSAQLKSYRPTVKVDADTRAAKTKITTLKKEVSGLDGRRISLRADADTTAAMVKLAALKKVADGLDGKNVKVNASADTSAAGSGLLQTVALWTTLAPAAIPVTATLGAGFVALGGALGAAGLGFGGIAAVAVPAITRIKTVLDAQSKAQKNSAAASVTAQAQANAEASAQQQLAAAVRESAQAHQQALDQVRSSEQQLTSAQVSALDAQRALTAARHDAARALVDMSNSTADARLSERQATFDLADAQARFNAVSGTKGATADQIARAKLALDQARQDLKERHLATIRTIADEKAGQKAGVEGSDAVRTARQQLAAANQQVANSELALSRAQQNVGRVDRQNADRIASARRALSDATSRSALAQTKLNASTLALSGPAQQLVKHWKALTTEYTRWNKALEPAVLPLFSKGIDLVRRSLPLLTPVVRTASGAVSGLLDDIGKAATSPFWKKFTDHLTKLVPTAITSLGHTAGNVATGVAGIFDAFLPSAPTVLKFIERISAKFAEWGKNLGSSKQFADFMRYVHKVAPAVGRDVVEIARALGNIVKALAGLGPGALGGVSLLVKLVAQMPASAIRAIAVAWLGVAAAQKAIKAGKGIKEFAGDVKGLASGAKSAAGKVRDLGLAQKSLAGAKALRDIGSTALTAATNVGKLAGAYLLAGTRAAGAAIKTVTFKAAQIAVTAATKTWTAIQWLLNIAMDANPIGLVVIAIGLLVAAFILAWKHSKTFRDIVTGTFNGIKKVITTVVNWIVDFVRKHWKLLLALIGGPIGLAVYLIVKYWKQIKDAFRAGTNWVTDKWRSLWNGVLSLAKRIGSSVVGAVSSFLDKVKGAFRTGVRDVGAIWGGLKKAVEAPIRFVIDRVINHGVLWAWDSLAKLLHLPASLQIPFLPLPFADGGIVKAYAGGGFENHTAQIAPAGAMRLWAEPETGGEAYIPLSENKRGRSTQILGQVADSFGYKLMPFSDGGILGWVKKAAGKSLGVVENLGKAALSAVTDPAKWVLDKLTKPVKALLGKVGDSNFGKAGVAVGEKALSAMSGALKSLLGQFAGGGGSSAMVNLARTQVGYHEGAGNSNKYSHAIGRPSEEWCADFIDWLAQKTGNRSAVPWTASAPGMARAFGSKYHSGTSGAMPGDIVFFGGSKAGIYHVGLASGTGSGGSIPTIAGNHGNAVRAYTGTGVAGYAHPNYPNPGTVGSAPGSLIHASPAKAKEWARQNLNTYGWQSQYNALNRLWTRESGWRWNARNPGSGAYGIPQSLPASKMRSAGADYHDNAGTQIKWGLGYIKGRYGSPNSAWAHSQRTGWYDSGGYMPPGYSVSYNGTGRPERLYTGHQVSQMSRNGDGASYHTTNNLYHRNITIQELDTLQRQQETRRRVGRAR